MGLELIYPLIGNWIKRVILSAGKIQVGINSVGESKIGWNQPNFTDSSVNRPIP